MKFSKYEGCGNDFILIDNREKVFLESHFSLIPRICHRHRGIGADGLILLENSQIEDFRMRIFNADGGEAEMCGNGVRCLIQFIREEIGIKKPHYRIETMHRLIQASFKEHQVAVDMGLPEEMHWNIPITIEGKIYDVHHVNTGVPHLILFTTDAHHFPMEVLGKQFRHHSLFAPKGVNFNVASIDSNGEIYNRTYERGVEGETLTCGTGCTAVAIAAAILQGRPSPIKIRSHAESLSISFRIENGLPTSLTMAGPATKIFSGTTSSL